MEYKSVKVDALVHKAGQMCTLIDKRKLFLKLKRQVEDHVNFYIFKGEASGKIRQDICYTGLS